MARGGKRKPGSTKTKPTKAKAKPKPKRKRISPVEKARGERNRRARERYAELKLAEQIAREELAASARGKDERELSIEWAEYMAPAGWGFSLTEAELAAQKRLPFLIVAKFEPPGGTTYADLHRTIKRWRDDLTLEAMIHPQRICSIRIVYHDPGQKRGEGDSVVSHAGPWELVVSEATHEIDPNDEDSLAVRYQDTTVIAVYVYFSGQIAKNNGWMPHYQRPK